MIKNFFKGLLFGAAAGTVGGLLLAPRSGNETRKKLIEELEEATTLTNDLNN
ncbi:YtxH domain-containing protein, partial [Escherichia coli]